MSSTDRPTGRQIYGALRLALTALDEQWPQTRGQASDLIKRLQQRTGTTLRRQPGEQGGTGSVSTRSLLPENRLPESESDLQGIARQAAKDARERTTNGMAAVT